MAAAVYPLILLLFIMYKAANGYSEINTKKMHLTEMLKLIIKYSLKCTMPVM